MCGRATLTIEDDELEEFLGFRQPFAHRPRYNIAPGQPVLAVVGAGRASELVWGLHAKSAAHPSRIFVNARSETAERLPSFRDAVRDGRILVPVDGFYEWKREGRHKIAHHVHLATREPFMLAAIAEPPRSGERLGRFCVLTRPSEGIVAQIHDRMPVVVARGNWHDWLAADWRTARRHVSAPSPAWEATRVSTYVNDVHHDDPACIDAASEGVSGAQRDLWR